MRRLRILIPLMLLALASPVFSIMTGAGLVSNAQQYLGRDYGSGLPPNLNFTGKLKGEFYRYHYYWGSGLWNGESAWTGGFDCSGLLSYAANLRRHYRTEELPTFLGPAKTWETAVSGDIVYFSGHVAIFINRRQDENNVYRIKVVHATEYVLNGVTISGVLEEEYRQSYYENNNAFPYAFIIDAVAPQISAKIIKDGPNLEDGGVYAGPITIDFGATDNVTEEGGPFIKANYIDNTKFTEEGVYNLHLISEDWARNVKDISVGFTVGGLNTQTVNSASALYENFKGISTSNPSTLERYHAINFDNTSVGISSVMIVGPQGVIWAPTFNPPVFSTSTVLADLPVGNYTVQSFNSVGGETKTPFKISVLNVHVSTQESTQNYVHGDLLKPGTFYFTTHLVAESPQELRRIQIITSTGALFAEKIVSGYSATADFELPAFSLSQPLMSATTFSGSAILTYHVRAIDSEGNVETISFDLTAKDISLLDGWDWQEYAPGVDSYDYIRSSDVTKSNLIAGPLVSNYGVVESSTGLVIATGEGFGADWHQVSEWLTQNPITTAQLLAIPMPQAIGTFKEILRIKDGDGVVGSENVVVDGEVFIDRYTDWESEAAIRSNALCFPYAQVISNVPPAGFLLCTRQSAPKPILQAAQQYVEWEFKYDRVNDTTIPRCGLVPDGTYLNYHCARYGARVLNYHQAPELSGFALSQAPILPTAFVPSGKNIFVPLNSYGEAYFDEVTSPGTLTVTAINSRPPAGFGETAPNITYQITPELGFTGEVKLTLKYPSDNLTAAQENQLKMVKVLDPATGKYMTLTAALNPENKTITVNITSFSKFMVIAPVYANPQTVQSPGTVNGSPEMEFMSGAEASLQQYDMSGLAGVGALAGLKSADTLPVGNVYSLVTSTEVFEPYGAIKMRYSVGALAGLGVEEDSLAIYGFTESGDLHKLPYQTLDKDDKVLTARVPSAAYPLFAVLASSQQVESIPPSVYPDGIPPVTAISFGGTTAPAPDGTYISSTTTIVLSASDPQVPGVVTSGVNLTKYILHPEFDLIEYTYAGPFTLPEGVHPIHYLSVDNAGNYEFFKATTITVDATPPVTELSASIITLAPGATFYAAISGTVTLTTSDPLLNGAQSGVYNTFYLVDENLTECQNLAQFLANPSNQLPTFNGQPGTCENPLYTGSFSLFPGTHTVQYLSFDNVLNMESLKTFYLEVQGDIVSPETFLLVNGSTVATGGTVSVATEEQITITAIDPVVNGLSSGVLGVYFLVDVATDSCGEMGTIISTATAGTCQNYLYTTPFALATGSHTVYYTAVDNVGNMAAGKSAYIIVAPPNSSLDTTPPVVTASANGEVLADGTTMYMAAIATVTLSAADEGAGLKEILYSVDVIFTTGTAGAYTAPFTLPLGTHTVYYSATDNAGNMAPIKSALITVWNSNVACGGTITENTMLGRDLNCTGFVGDVLTIVMDNVVFDGNGYKIIAPSATVAVGINAIDDTVRNINLNGSAGTGVRIGKSNTEVNNVTAVGRTIGVNIVADNSTNIKILNSDLSGPASPGGIGVQIWQMGPVTNLEIRNNTILLRSEGIKLHTANPGSANWTIVGNNVRGATGMAISIAGPRNPGELHLSDTLNKFSNDITDSVNGVSCRSCVFDGEDFARFNLSGTAVSLYEGAIRNSDVSGNAGTGIGVIGSTTEVNNVTAVGRAIGVNIAADNSTNIKVLNSDFSGPISSGGIGVVVWQMNAITNLEIRNNTILRRNEGIKLHTANPGSANWTIVGNNVREATGMAVSVSGPRNLGEVRLSDILNKFDNDITNSVNGVSCRSCVFDGEDFARFNLSGTAVSLYEGAIRNSDVSGSAGTGVGVIGSTTEVNNVTAVGRAIGVNIQADNSTNIKIINSDFSGPVSSGGIGIQIWQMNPVTNLEVRNNTILRRNEGIKLHTANAGSTNWTVVGNNVRGAGVGVAQVGILLSNAVSEVDLADNVVANFSTGISLSAIVNARIIHNNIFGNGLQAFSGTAVELSYNGEGNYWGRASAPYFIPGTDSNRLDVIDNYPYSRENGWVAGGDTTPPVTEAIIGGQVITGSTTVYMAEIDSITLTASDDGSGLSEIYYTVDVAFSTQSAITYTVPFSLSLGTHTIYYTAVDNADNQAAVKSINVLVWNSNVTCGGTITENTMLAADLDCNAVTGTALTIGADNLILDGNGHKIIAPNAFAVVSAIGRRNVMVRNTDLSGPTGQQKGYGLNLVTVNNSVMENVTTHNREYGIFSDWGGGSNVFRGNDLTGNGTGMKVNGASVTVINNMLGNNVTGLLGNVVSNFNLGAGNDFNGSTTAVLLSGSFNSVVEGLTLNNPTGLVLSACHDVTVRNMDLSGPIGQQKGHGLDLVTVTNSVIENVTAHNREYGVFSDWGGGTNVFRGNNLTNNGTGMKVNGASVTVAGNMLGNNMTGLFGYMVSSFGLGTDNDFSGSTTAVLLSGSFNSVVEGLTLNNPTGLVLSACHDITVKNMDLSGPAGQQKGHGLDLVTVTNSVIENVTAHNREYGVFSDWGGGTNVFQGNNLTGNKTGLMVNGASVTVTNNMLGNNVTGLFGNVVSNFGLRPDNDFNGSTTAVLLSQCSGVVEGLTLNNPVGLLLSACHDVTVRNMDLSGPVGQQKGHGLDLVTVTNSVIENVTAHNREYGVFSDWGGGTNVFQGNNLTGNKTGLMVNGASVTVTNNMLGNNVTGLFGNVVSNFGLRPDNDFNGSTTAVVISQGFDSVVEGLTLNNPTGLVLSACQDVMVRNMVLSGQPGGKTGTGINITSSNNLRLVGVLVANHNIGIKMEGACGGNSIDNNTIVNNNTGLLFMQPCSGASIVNSIVWGNTDDIQDQTALNQVSYSNVQEALISGPGNIQANPIFVDISVGDFRLKDTSPSIDTGTNAVAGLPVMDLDGHPRLHDGNGDGNAVVDMGAYESQYTMLLDVTPPVTTALVNGQVLADGATVYLAATGAISLTAVDEGSGVKDILYSVDVVFSTGTADVYTAPFTLSVGAHIIYYAAIDKTGNIAQVASANTVVWNSNIACGGTITENTILAADLDCTGFTGVVLNLGANNIAFDGGGHRIIAPNALTSIRAESRRNIIIKDVDISGTGSGIGMELLDVRDSLIENVTAQHRVTGIKVWDGNNGGYFNSNLIFRNLNLSGDGTGDGLDLLYAHGGLVENVTAHNREYGVRVYSGTGDTTVRNSDLSGNKIGLWVGPISTITVSGNNLSNSVDAGLYINKSSSITALGNNLSGNNRGVYIYDSRNVDLRADNDFHASTVAVYGVWLWDSVVDGLVLNNSKGIYIERGRNLVFRNLDLSGVGGGTGMELMDVQDSLIENVTAQYRSIAIKVWDSNTTGSLNRGLIFRNLQLSGSSATGGGLNLSNSKDIVVENITSHGSYYGVRIGESSQNVTVRGSDLSQNINGVWIDTWASTITIGGNNISSSNASGLYITSASSITAIGNDFSRSRNGIYTTNAWDISLDLNNHPIVSSAPCGQGGYGVYGKDVINVTVKNGTIQKFNSGIRFENGSGIVVANNNLSDNTGGGWQAGISFDNVINSTITNNTIVRQGAATHGICSQAGTGIWTNNSTKNEISGNRVTDNTYYGFGIALNNSPQNTLTDNHLEKNSWDDIQFLKSPGNVLRGNIMTRSISFGGWGEGCDLASLSQPDYIQDIDESNLIGGKPIKYFDGQHVPCPTSQTITYGQMYSEMIFVGCNNTTLKDTDMTHSLYVLFGDNFSLDNIKTAVMSNMHGATYWSTKNSKIANSDFGSTASNGLKLCSSDNNEISSSTVRSGWHGLFLDKSNNNVFNNNAFQYSHGNVASVTNSTGNVFNSNAFGPAGAYHALTVSNSQRNIFTNNSFRNNPTYRGIGLYDNSNSNTFTGNTITGNNYGLAIDKSGGNLIKYNTIYGNKRALQLTSILPDNQVTHNNIYNNTVPQVWSDAAMELSYNQEGNNWGKTSLPYFKAGTEDSNRPDVVDSYPYGQADAWMDITAVSPSFATVSRSFSISGVAFGPYSALTSKVLIGTAAANVSMWTNTTIEAKVPYALLPGVYSLVVERELDGVLLRTSTVAFTVLPVLSASEDGEVMIATPGTEMVITAVSTGTWTPATPMYSALTEARLAPLMDAFYDFEPSGVQFAVPAKLTFIFDAVQVDTSAVAIYYFDGVTWSSASVLNQAIGLLADGRTYIEGYITHTSTYAVLSYNDNFPPVILSMEVYPGTITPENNSVNVQYELSEPGYVTLDVLSSTAPYSALRSIYSAVSHATGLWSVPWDGKGSNNAALGDGAYTLRLTVADESGNIIGSQDRMVSIDNYPQVLGITAKPASFNPSSGERARFVFSVSEEVTLDVAVKDIGGVLIKDLAVASMYPAGALSFYWNGYNNSALMVQPGMYHITVKAVDRTGHQIEVPGGNCEVLSPEYPTITGLTETPDPFYPGSPDPDLNTVTFSYQLTAVSTVSAVFPVTVSISHPVMGIVKTMTFEQGGGAHSLQWDGVSDPGSALAGQPAPDGAYREEISVNVDGNIASASGAFSLLRNNVVSAQSSGSEPAVTVQYDDPDVQVTITANPPVTSTFSAALLSQTLSGNVLASPIYDIVATEAFTTQPVLRFKYDPIYDGESLALYKYSVLTGEWIQVSTAYYVDIANNEIILTLNPDVFLGSLFALMKGSDSGLPASTISVGKPSFEAFGLKVITPGTLISVAAVDEGEGASGVDKIFCAVDSGAYAEYAAPFPIMVQGEHAVRCRAIDKAGNAEAAKELRVTVMPLESEAIESATGMAISGNADITGHTRANAVMALAGNAKIKGGAIASDVILKGKAAVTGQVVKTANTLAVEPVALGPIARAAAASNNNDLVAAAYLQDGSLIVSTKVTLELPAGKYYFKKIELSGGASVTLKGNTDILVEGPVGVSGGSSLNAEGPASQLKLFVNSESSVTLSGGAKAAAYVYAPKAALRLSGNVQAGGHWFAKSVELSGNGNVVQSGESLPGAAVSFKAAEFVPLADATFRLGEVYAYPNPAKGGKNPILHIETGIADRVEVRIFDIAGDLVHQGAIDGLPQLIDDGQGPQYAYEYEWGARGNASGVYLYSIEARKGGERLRRTGKLAVIK